MLRLKEENQKKIEKFRKELRDYPVTRNWSGERLAVVAELMVAMNLESADDWFLRVYDKDLEKDYT